MMEQTTYEDMVRTMMGKNAYLMFVFDRLVFAVSYRGLFNAVDSEEHPRVSATGWVPVEHESV